MKITEDDLKQAEEFTAFMNKVIMEVWHKNMIKVDRGEWGKLSKFTFPEEHQIRPHLDATNTITDEIAKKIIEEANKACSKCKSGSIARSASTDIGERGGRMSERASFTSEYIYSWDDYKKVRKALDKKSKHLCIAPPVDWGAGELPIVQGKVGSLCLGMEYYTLADALDGVQVDDSVDFVVISDYECRPFLVRLSPTGDVCIQALGVAEDE